MRYVLIWICMIITHAGCSQSGIKTYNYNSSLWKSAEEIDEIRLKYKAYNLKCTKISHPLIQSPSMIQGSKAIFKLTDKKQSFPPGMGNSLGIKFDKFNITFNRGAFYKVYLSNEGSLLCIEEKK